MKYFYIKPYLLLHYRESLTFFKLLPSLIGIIVYFVVAANADRMILLDKAFATYVNLSGYRFDVEMIASFNHQLGLLIMIPIFSLFLIYIVLLCVIRKAQWKQHAYFLVFPIISYVLYFTTNNLLVEILKNVFQRPRPFQTRDFNQDLPVDCAFLFRAVFQMDKQANTCKIKDVQSTPSGHNCFCFTCIFGMIQITQICYRYIRYYLISERKALTQDKKSAETDAEVANDTLATNKQLQNSVEHTDTTKEQSIKGFFVILEFALWLMLVIFVPTMMLSRISVNMHYFSDVILGAATGLIGTFFITCFEPYFKK